MKAHRFRIRVRKDDLVAYVYSGWRKSHMAALDYFEFLSKLNGFELVGDVEVVP